ncbi:hypothetical protein A2U01_0103937, partial [Trifolium medium]|nr:hypothetical protein [Trifolium medium]
MRWAKRADLKRAPPSSGIARDAGGAARGGETSAVPTKTAITRSIFVRSRRAIRQ